MQEKVTCDCPGEAGERHTQQTQSQEEKRQDDIHDTTDATNLSWREAVTHDSSTTQQSAPSFA